MLWWQVILAYFGIFIAVGAGILVGVVAPKEWTESKLRQMQWTAGIIVLIVIFWFVEGKNGDLHHISRMRVGDLLFRIVLLALALGSLIGLIVLWRRLFRILQRTYGQTRFWNWTSDHAVAIYVFCLFIVTPTLLFMLRALGYGY